MENLTGMNVSETRKSDDTPYRCIMSERAGARVWIEWPRLEQLARGVGEPAPTDSINMMDGHVDWIRAKKGATNIVIK